MSADEDMLAMRRRRRQYPHQIRRARLDASPEPWRQSSANHELPFQPGRQVVASGQSRRQTIGIVALAIPMANGILIIAAIIAAVAVVAAPIVPVPPAVPVITVVAVAPVPIPLFVVIVAVALRRRSGSRPGQQSRCRQRAHPCFRSHDLSSCCCLWAVLRA